MSWDAGLPASLLARVVGLGSPSQRNSNPQEATPVCRLVCRAWQQAIDANVLALCPPGWPLPRQSCEAVSSAIIPHPCLRTCQFLDLTRLSSGGRDEQLGQSTNELLLQPCAGGAGTSAIGEAGGNCSSTRLGLLLAAGSIKQQGGSASTSSQLDLNGAAVLQPRSQQQQEADAAAATTASLTCYVASMWPAAVPLVTPAACYQLWKQMPLLPQLQQLRLSGSMLLVQSVLTTAEDDESSTTLSATPVPSTITHTYVLRLPETALCSMTNLQALSVDWQLRTANSSDAPTLPVRRRSYEGGSSTPHVQHVADPAIQLPQRFNNLVSLQRLELGGGDITDASTLLPLVGLQSLTQLVLGPGRLAMQALVPLAAAGTLGGLHHLVLKQQGSWDVASVVAVLAAVTALRQLEVEELEMTRSDLSAAGPLQESLSPAHFSPLSSSLTSLRWATCKQRLAGGASLLCRAPAAAGLPAEQHAEDSLATAAGPWLGALSALQTLQLQGILRNGSVLVAPALEALSSSIGACSQLEVLSVKQLGLPLLPDTLARLPRLRSVSIEACSIVRRVVLQPEQVLAVLGRCSSLEQLTLSGCELRQVPAWLAGLRGVTSLQLNGNYLSDMPATHQACMGLPPALQRLNLCDNRLRELPDSVAQLSSLTQLLLDSNYLNSLPAAIWDLPALAELSARENMLSQLPECSAVRAPGTSQQHAVRSSTTSMSSEESAAAAGCCSAGAGRRAVGPVAEVLVAVAAAPVVVQGAAAAASWQGLSAEERELLTALGILHRGPGSTNSSRSGAAAARGTAATPAAALSAPLPELSLEHDLLFGAAACASPVHLKHQHAVPEVCGCAGSLRCLVLAENQLTELPASIAQLSSLKQLDLRKNQLRLLDKSPLWALSRLTHLNLADNQLRKLPSGLAKLQHLVELDVSGNFLSVSMPREGRSNVAGSAAAAVSAAVSAAAHTAAVPAAAAVSAAAGVCRRLSLDGGSSSRASPPTADAVAAAAAASSCTGSGPCGSRGAPVPTAVATAAAVVNTSSREGRAGQQPGAVVTVLDVDAPSTGASAASVGSRPVCHVTSRKGQQGQGQQVQQVLRRQLKALPSPLGGLQQLQQVRLGRQQADGEGSSWVGQCPLQLLLDGLSDLADRLRCLAPVSQHHQCPVAKAAAAAVAHITGASSSRRGADVSDAQQLRDAALLERMSTEAGWVVVPVKRPQPTPAR